MANLTQVQALPGGTVLTATTPTAGPDNLPPGDGSVGVYLIVDNASGGSTTVTILDPGKSKYGVANGSVVKAVAAGTKQVFGPFYGDLQQSDGFIDVTSSVTASVSFFTFRG
jgi:hypothetical protein